MKERLNYIDSMRGIAILMVILVHTAQSVKNVSILFQYIAAYGQMGVQLFFIVSAYTLCHSWLKRNDEQHKIINFAIRRFFRIAPAYYMGLGIYFIVSIFENLYRNGMFQPADQYSFFNIAINLVFLNGFYPPANNNIVPGGWSIGTEMAFYAMFPLLMFLVVNRYKKLKYTFFYYPLIGLAISQIILRMIFSLTGKMVGSNNFLYFNISNQLPVFLTGISFYFLNSQGRWPIRTAICNAIWFICFALLNLLLWNMSSNYYFSLIPFISGISFVFLVKTFELVNWANFALLQKIGRVSYSMYIFHVLFAHKAAQLVNKSLAAEEVLGGDITLISYYIFTILLTFILAKVSERHIERNFIAIGGRIIKKYNSNCTTRRSNGLAEARR